MYTHGQCLGGIYLFIFTHTFSKYWGATNTAVYKTEPPFMRFAYVHSGNIQQYYLLEVFFFSFYCHLVLTAVQKRLKDSRNKQRMRHGSQCWHRVSFPFEHPCSVCSQPSKHLLTVWVIRLKNKLSHGLSTLLASTLGHAYMPCPRRSK